MKILLFLDDKIVSFYLSTQISGSYSFDADEDEESKLINIEERKGKWILYSTEESVIVDNEKTIDQLEVELNRYYNIKRYNKIYNIYIKKEDENNIEVYKYGKNIHLNIGTKEDNSIRVMNKLVGDTTIDIAYSDMKLCLKQTDTIVYVNNKKIKTNDYIIEDEDRINIYGLEISFYSNLLIIDSPKKNVAVLAPKAGIVKFSYTPENYKNIDIKDVDLYNKDNYFSKSPRIRRKIEEKEIKIDLPPRPKELENMPLILTIGPMISMGVTSCVTLISTLGRISNDSNYTLNEAWIVIIPTIVTLVTTAFWPLIVRAYNNHSNKVDREKLIKDYCEYLKERKEELEKEVILETSILKENLLTCEDCMKIINYKRNNFWDKRVEQSDFLEVRVGIGDVPLKVKLNIREDEFTVEQDFLKKEAIKLSKSFEKINNVPVGFSLFENYLTAVMGPESQRYNFLNNIILQLVTFYCYDELKFIVFTSEENEKKWEYLKYSNYIFNNDKTLRFFSSKIEDGEKIAAALNPELQYRMEIANNKQEYIPFKPYYILIIDDYNTYKKLDFLRELTEVNKNVGYTTIILESSLSKLPSKCLNFINLSEGKSGILKNSFDNQEIVEFQDEINDKINMKEILKILSNIPVEIEGAQAQLPNSISFLDMEKVGKVEQLNILNRWSTNDSTKSLKAEIGIKEDGNYMYLDLHEKYHGPHGLIAGMTGSGKSEFIITYILSMAMNYSPDDISFVLIDYKGGGLAYAFENKTTGVVLPHLAGTITNLDTSEMNRTLISIDSEVKRRQTEFNKARDILGESTIDIYKYQKYYHEGKLKDPIPHLLIISDEFAELKSQQPDFMNNLISVARIGRSLGVHLILATQKPSGVVNDQIWSNAKFKICLKVQDEIDSREMLKKTDAANIKQTGRFYLQVGFDEYYALGQSAWCGAKYYPSEKIIKQVDKSINIIDNDGMYIKSIQADSKHAKLQAQGEQLPAILNEIIKVAKDQNKQVNRLWLENIPETVLIEDLEKKYNYESKPYEVKAIIGEYDAPEKQEQGLVEYNLLENGNTIIYGIDGIEREKLLFSLIYSATKNHSSDELQIYGLDYGSEALRSFLSLPHIGDFVFPDEEDRYRTLIKMIKKEETERKKKFIDFGGTYKNYINSGNKMPTILVIINNFESLRDSMETINDDLPEIIRDSSRYGISFVITANGLSSVSSRVSQLFPNIYTLHLKDYTDCYSFFKSRNKLIPKDYVGRGLLEADALHEFQTASIVEDEAKQSEFLINFINEQKAKNNTYAKRIPTMPEHITFEIIEKELSDMTAIPVGIGKERLDIKRCNFDQRIFNVISSSKLENTQGLVRSLIRIFKEIKVKTIIVDTSDLLLEDKEFVDNYFNNDFDNIIGKLNDFLDKLIEANNVPKVSNVCLIFMGLDKLLSKLSDKNTFSELFNKIKQYEKVSTIIIEINNKLRNCIYESWYSSCVDNSNGIWIGTGMQDQNVFKNSTYSKEQNREYKNDMGFFIYDGIASLMKVLDFYNINTGDEEDE